MGEQNKILDVTYGKFSCRLEGFDDAVETMKAVVTFFHDLAGHESFAEIAPGMPDLETLAKMAEAQSGGSVTAAPMGNGVSLTRTVEEEEANAAEEVSAAFAERADLQDQSEDFASDEDAQVDAVEEAAELAEDEPVIAESSEEDTGAENIFDAHSDTGDAWDEEIAEEALADDETDALEETTFSAEEAVDHTQDDLREAVSDEPFAAAADEDAADEDTAPAVLQDEATTPESEDNSDDEESFTSKLDRIRAVVSRGATSARAQVEEPAEPATVRPGNPLAQRLAELAKRNSELMQADDRAISPLDEMEEAPEPEAAFDDPPSHDNVAEAADAAEVERDWDNEAATVLQDDEPQEAEAFELMADTISTNEMEEAAVAAEDEGEVAETEVEAEDETEFVSVDDTDETEPLAAEAEEGDSLVEDEDDHEEAASSADIDDVTADETGQDDDRPTSAPSAGRPLLLTTPQRPVSEDASEDDDDDFDLSAELAEIEKEIAARPRNEMTRHGLPRRVEDAMSRIFMQTNQQLDEPEGRRHRDALAQLKAAVAATEAAEQLGDKHRSRDAGEAYRDDLGALETESRKGSGGLPPLKLVTPDDDEDVAEVPEPRITSKPLDIAAQRLREIAATKDASEDSDKSVDFVDFLEKQGVSDLGDKLEAAAAYLTFVDGEPDFTRPQLMRLVQSASREEITREDGLRCFGRLLRQSRFAKLNNGRFKVDDNTPFRPRSSRVAQG